MGRGGGRGGSKPRAWAEAWLPRPDGWVTGTADPVLRRTIQEALADPAGDYDPRLRAFVPGPASHYDGHSLEWVACIQGALLARGLCGRASGYRCPPPAGHAPGPTPRG